MNILNVNPANPNSTTNPNSTANPTSATSTNIPPNRVSPQEAHLAPEAPVPHLQQPESLQEINRTTSETEFLQDNLRQVQSQFQAVPESPANVENQTAPALEPEIDAAPVTEIEAAPETEVETAQVVQNEEPREPSPANEPLETEEPRTPAQQAPPTPQQQNQAATQRAYQADTNSPYDRPLLNLLG